MPPALKSLSLNIAKHILLAGVAALSGPLALLLLECGRVTLGCCQVRVAENVPCTTEVSLSLSCVYHGYVFTLESIGAACAYINTFWI